MIVDWPSVETCMSGGCLNRCLRACYSVSDYTRIISDFLSDVGPGTCCVVVVVERHGEGAGGSADLACLFGNLDENWAPE